MNAPPEMRNPAGGRGFERLQTLALAAWSLYIIVASIFAGFAIGSLIVALGAAVAGAP